MRNAMRIVLVLAVFGFGSVSNAQPTPKSDTTSALARLVHSMKAETWAMLNKDGDDSGYGAKFTDSGVGGLYGYASKAT